MADTNKNINILIKAKDQTKAAFKGVQDNLLGVAAALAAVKIGTDILLDITKVGAESEKQWLAVEGALKRHNIEVASGTKEIRTFADEMQTLTGVSDEVVATGIRRFVDFGASIKEAKEQMRVATDLAVGSGLSLSSATDLISKAQVGYTSTLSRYGIIISESIPKSEKFAAAIEQIKEKFGGAAQDVAASFAVRMEVLSERFGDLKEDIFRLLQPALEVVLESFIALVKIGAKVVEIFQLITNSISGTDDKLIATAALTAGWTAEINSLITALEDGEITIESFKLALEGIGKFELTPEEIVGFSDDMEILSDNTARWGISLEHLERVVPTVTESLDSMKEAASKLAQTIETTRRLNAQRVFPSILGIEEEDLQEDEKLALESLNRLHEALLERNEKLKALNQQTFDVRLQQMSDFEAEVAIMEEARQERERIIMEAKLQDQDLVNQLLLESQQLFDQQMIQLSEETQATIAEEWLERWSFVQDQTTKIFQNMFVTLFTNAKNLKDVMKKTFEEIGKTIVRHLAGLAVDAIFSFIAGTVAATAAMKIEQVATEQLTSSYISLAAAKSAANPLSAPGRIAAAAAVKGSLEALLGSGSGAADAIGGSFGLPSIPIPGGAGPQSQGAPIQININAPLVDAELISNVLIPAIEELSINGVGRIAINNQNENGEGSIAFA